MALTIPSSMQNIVGDRLLRLATSYDKTRFFIDIPKANPYRGRTRYGYQLNGAFVTGSYNLAPLLGATVLSITLVEDATKFAKLVFTTNPTGSKLEHSIIYITSSDDELSYLIQQNDDYILQENQFKILIQYGGSVTEASLVDTVIANDTYQSKDSNTKFFVIQEDDF